jgi:hypothetical protein
MKILVLCMFGMNRSKYLAEYLKGKGFETDYDGVNNENWEAVQEKINWSDTVITVSHDTHEKARMDFDFVGKKVYTLDVEDCPKAVLPGSEILNGDAWTDFQNKSVYPKLIEQANKVLNIK